MCARDLYYYYYSTLFSCRRGQKPVYLRGDSRVRYTANRHSETERSVKNRISPAAARKRRGTTTRGKFGKRQIARVSSNPFCKAPFHPSFIAPGRRRSFFSRFNNIDRYTRIDSGNVFHTVYNAVLTARFSHEISACRGVVWRVSP